MNKHGENHLSYCSHLTFLSYQTHLTFSFLSAIPPSSIHPSNFPPYQKHKHNLGVFRCYQSRRKNAMLLRLMYVQVLDTCTCPTQVCSIFLSISCVIWRVFGESYLHSHVKKRCQTPVPKKNSKSLSNIGKTYKM